MTKTKRKKWSNVHIWMKILHLRCEQPLYLKSCFIQIWLPLFRSVSTEKGASVCLNFNAHGQMYVKCRCELRKTGVWLNGWIWMSRYSTLGLSSLFCLLYEKEEKEDLPSVDKELNMAARARAMLQREWMRERERVRARAARRASDPVSNAALMLPVRLNHTLLLLNAVCPALAHHTHCTEYSCLLQKALAVELPVAGWLLYKVWRYSLAAIKAILARNFDVNGILCRL